MCARCKVEEALARTHSFRFGEGRRKRYSTQVRWPFHGVHIFLKIECFLANIGFYQNLIYGNNLFTEILQIN